MRGIYKRPLFLLIVPAIATLFCGCGLKDGDQALEEIVERTYQVGPAVRLSVSNADGAIRVYGADVTEIHVQAVKKAYSTARLRKIDINISTQPGSVSIETNYPPRKTWGLTDRSGTVDYTLVVPQTCVIAKLDLAAGEMLIEGLRGGSAHAHLRNGRLFVHNCFGDIDLTAENGGIDIYYDWWDEIKLSIKAEIADGGVRAFIPGDASFHLLAETEDGHVANDFAEKEQRQRDVRKIDKIIGTQAGAEVRLHARNGNIKIAEVTF
jgi:putative adhesin